MKRRLILCLILGLTLVAAACGSKDNADKTVPFNLNEDWLRSPSDKAILLQSKDEMTAFLADESLFTKEPSQEFTEINNRYDDDYFKQNDLVALIIWASSGSYYGYRLGKPVERSGIWVIETMGLAHGNVVTDDMGKIFCYYVEVPKKAGVTGVSTTSSSNSDINIKPASKYHLEATVIAGTAEGFPKSGNYKSGHTFRFYVRRVTDGSFHVYLDDVEIMPVSTGTLHDKGDYYVITMPDADAKLVVTHEEFYLDKDYSMEEVFWWVKRVSREKLTELVVSERDLSSYEASAPVSISDKESLDSFFEFLGSDGLRKSGLRIGDAAGGVETQISFIVGGVPYTLSKIDLNGKEYIWWKDFSSSQLFEMEKKVPEIKIIEPSEVTVVHMEGPGPDVGLLAALENFYEDDEYVYSFPYIMSGAITCKLSDGSVMTFAEAFKKGIATIADLDAHGFKYYKNPKIPLLDR